MTTKITPVVGMGASLQLYTDRKPYEIVRVSATGKTLWARQMTCTKYDEGGYGLEFESNPGAFEERFVYKADRWVGGGYTLWIGEVRAYYDPHF